MTTPNTETPLKIVRLTASNVMRLKAGIEIVPKDPTVTVSGKNKQGKSAVLNCILFALGGKSALPAVPVRKGAAAADVHLDLDELVIDWRCTAAGTVSLLVRLKSGGQLKSPQTTLDTLWNKMCDPVKFIRLSESPEGCRKQAEILRQIVNLDFTALDTERKSLYDERQDKGRELKNYQGQLTGLVFHADAPGAEVTSQSLLDELQGANSHNENIREQEAKVTAIEKEMAQDTKRIDEITSEIEELERQLESKRTSRTVREKNYQTLSDQLRDQTSRVACLHAVDVDPIKTKLSGIDSVNKQVRENANRRSVEQKIRDAQARIDVLSNQIDEVDEEKRTKLANAPFPIPGLAFDDTGILLDGVPFNQGSQAEQLVAATAIALALKPRIRVVLLRDASLLDVETRKRVAELAEREGAQVWEEVVESTDDSAIVIEDGEIKEKE